MELNPGRIPVRDKSILLGLYLSKYDTVGLRRLGFETFSEAFNALGFAVGAKPASVKNYRDEFDPLFPNRRKGWHKRQVRQYCLKVLEEYGCLDLESFSALVESLAGYNENADTSLRSRPGRRPVKSSFAERLITGLAAEQYFESIQKSIPEFTGYVPQNTTRLGCGYDFRLDKIPPAENFLAVEVKGLKGVTGLLSMTPKERQTAASLRNRFFLFVVKNFRETPYHEIFQDPLNGSLTFRKQERVMVQVSWIATV